MARNFGDGWRESDEDRYRRGRLHNERLAELKRQRERAARKEWEKRQEEEARIRRIVREECGK